MHPYDSAKPLLLLRPLVVVALAFDQRSLVDPHEGQLAVGIINDLEGHGHGWLGIIRRKLEGLVRIVPFFRINGPFQRTGQVAGDGVE